MSAGAVKVFNQELLEMKPGRVGPFLSDPVQPRVRRDLSIDYLRTIVTMVVLIHHSMVAYATWAIPPGKNLFRSVIPIVDSTRWSFIDYVIGFNDVFFMVLMFFISGLFTYPAIKKHGTRGFILERLKRLGIPFLFAVFVLNPIAYYVPWKTSGHASGFIDMYRHLAASGFSPGPAWFIWLLLTMDLCMALVIKACARPSFSSVGMQLQKITGSMRNQPFAAAVAMFFLSAVVYVPMLYHYGYTRWMAILMPPFFLQISRVFLYPLWFAFGALAGAWGLSRGILSRDGALPRRWYLWFGAALAVYNLGLLFRVAMWSHPFLLAHSRTPPTILWIACCVLSSFGFIGFFLRVPWGSSRIMQSLSRCAYGIYLVHYMFITAAQQLLLYRPIHPAIKTLFVFAVTLLLSWLTTVLALRIPRLKTII